MTTFRTFIITSCCRPVPIKTVRVVGVAKAGCEEDCDLIGGSCIVAPTGEIVAQAKTLEDELVIYRCDLDRCREIQDNIFNFAEHREPENYRLIVETRGIVR